MKRAAVLTHFTDFKSVEYEDVDSEINVTVNSFRVVAQHVG